jgi:hypothetical protein
MFNEIAVSVPVIVDVSNVKYPLLQYHVPPLADVYPVYEYILEVLVKLLAALVEFRIRSTHGKKAAEALYTRYPP